MGARWDAAVAAAAAGLRYLPEVLAVDAEQALLIGHVGDIARWLIFTHSDFDLSVGAVGGPDLVPSFQLSTKDLVFRGQEVRHEGLLQLQHWRCEHRVVVDSMRRQSLSHTVKLLPVFCATRAG